MKTEKLILLFTKLKSLLSEDKIDEAFTVLNKMKLFCYECKKLKNNQKDKMYHYGITITRNPNVQTLEQFVVYAERFKRLKYFTESEFYQFGYEAFSEGKLINEHVHIQVSSLQYLSVKDFKKAFPHRIDVQRLKGIEVLKTRQYVQKDNNDIQTIHHFSDVLKFHYGKKDAENI